MTDLHHSVHWTIRPEHVEGSFECHAPLEAACRLECAERCGAETFPCYSEDETGEYWEHELVDSGECNAVRYLNASQDAAITYEGEQDAPVVSGPIIVYSDGDGVTWEYPKADGGERR